MQTVYSPRHAGHAGNVELMPGAIVPAFEMPRRAESSGRGSRRSGLGRSWRRRSTTSRPPGGCMRRTISISCRRPGRCGGGGPGGLSDALRLADAGAARRRAARRHRRAARLLHLRRGRDLRRGHMGRDQGEPRRGADRGGAGARRRSAPPSRSAARPGTTPGARFAGGYCFVNNAAVAAEWLRERGRGAGERPRRRLPPRQRHPGDLLRPRRRAGGQHPCRPDGGVSLLPRPCRRARRRAGRRLQPQPAAAARHRTSRLERGARRPPARRWPTSRRRRWWSRSGSTPSAGPDQPVQAEPATIRRSARASRRSGCRRSS